MIINYVKRGDVQGTWLETHFRWQIRTFWFGLLWVVLCGLFVLATLGLGLFFVWIPLGARRDLVHLSRRSRLAGADDGDHVRLVATDIRLKYSQTTRCDDGHAWPAFPRGIERPNHKPWTSDVALVMSRSTRCAAEGRSPRVTALRSLRSLR